MKHEGLDGPTTARGPVSKFTNAQQFSGAIQHARSQLLSRRVSWYAAPWLDWRRRWSRPIRAFTDTAFAYYRATSIPGPSHNLSEPLLIISSYLGELQCPATSSASSTLTVRFHSHNTVHPMSGTPFDGISRVLCSVNSRLTLGQPKRRTPRRKGKDNCVARRGEILTGPKRGILANWRIKQIIPRSEGQVYQISRRRGAAGRTPRNQTGP